MLVILHYVIVVGLILVPAAVIAMSQGRMGTAVVAALDTQPGARSSINRALILGIAFTETSGILAGLIGVALLSLIPVQLITWGSLLMVCGMFCATAIPASLVSYCSVRPHRAAVLAIARQPFHESNITYLMILELAMMQMAVILGTILTFFMYVWRPTEYTVLYGVQCLASGIAFGFGSVGPSLGMGKFAAATCDAVGINPRSFNNVMSFSFVSQALIETPLLFALAVSGAILTQGTVDIVRSLAAACAVAIGTFGPGVSSGTIATSACKAISRDVERAPIYTAVSMLSQAIVDLSVIYIVLVAAALLFVAW